MKFALNNCLGDNRKDVTLAEDNVLLAVDLDFSSGVLAEDDTLADLDLKGKLLAVIKDTSGPDCNDLALLGLFLSSVGKLKTALGSLFALNDLDDDTICKWLQLHCIFLPEISL